MNIDFPIPFILCWDLFLYAMTSFRPNLVPSIQYGLRYLRQPSPVHEEGLLSNDVAALRVQFPKSDLGFRVDWFSCSLLLFDISLFQNSGSRSPLSRRQNNLTSRTFSDIECSPDTPCAIANEEEIWEQRLEYCCAGDAGTRRASRDEDICSSFISITESTHTSTS